MKIKNLIFFSLFLLTISCRQNNLKSIDDSKSISDKTNSEVNLETNNLKSKIKEANNNYKISDSIAIETLLKNIEIREMVDYHYKDSTIKNDFLISETPTSESPDWEIEVCQFQSRIEKYNTLLIIKMNANSGDTRVIDNQLNPEKELSLEDWNNLKNEKKRNN